MRSNPLMPQPRTNIMPALHVQQRAIWSAYWQGGDTPRLTSKVRWLSADHRSARWTLLTEISDACVFSKEPAGRQWNAIWWKGRDSNPRPRHYEVEGQPENVIRSIT